MFYVFACFMCDVSCDAVWFVFVVACFVCVGALFMYLCDVLMINDVLSSGFVLCCCAFARVGFNVCSLCLMFCVVSYDLFFVC